MSPDDHYADLKRIIAAVEGQARRINVIMPFLYESRQHKRTGRESLDCALGLRELYDMGVDNLITFDAHDPRVINAAPLNGFENIKPSYQFLKNLCKYEKDLKFDKDHLVMISPDEGAIDRSVYFASVLGIDMGMFYKRRDYSQVVDGVNPIVAHEYLGTDLAGKDVIVVDDMISSGGSMIDTAKDLKDRGANRVFIFATFGLFTNGMSKFDEAYEKGLFTRVLTTNLTYQNPELLSREYYTSVDMSKYISYIIDTLNHDASISDLLDPSSKIKSLVERYEAGQLSADDIDKME
jgi:ribose-phosphate pyrophosphokinase